MPCERVFLLQVLWFALIIMYVSEPRQRRHRCGIVPVPLLHFNVSVTLTARLCCASGFSCNVAASVV